MKFININNFQTMIYNRLLPFIGTKRMKNIKFALGITSTVACNVSFVFAAISLLSFTGNIIR